MRSSFALVSICFIVSVASSSLWNCGNSSSAQNYIKHVYTDIATKIRNHFQAESGKGSAFSQLTDITDRFGPRIIGSESLENAIDYIVDNYKSDFKVHTEPFQTYKWVRKYESAKLMSPVRRNMRILGLGTTVPTPQGGIVAEVIVVRSFDELKTLGTKFEVRGKIVVFNQPWVNYDQASAYRIGGASEAAKYGAIATLIRSAASFSIYSPHTGVQDYQVGVEKIPTACITVEDAQMLDRLQMKGEKISIHLEIDSRITDTNVTMRNVIIDYPGRLYPNEIVLIGGHIDSWDVGTGAMDDLSGVVLNLATLKAFKALNLQPKRTIRVILWNAEEQGHFGSAAYYRDNKDNTSISHVFVAESDEGAFRPSGLNFTAQNKSAVDTMQSIIKLLEPIQAANLTKASDTGDGGEFVRYKDIPGGWLENAKSDDYYFRFHHSMGDRATVYQNPGHEDDLDYTSIFWTTLAFVIGDLDANSC